MKKRKIDKSELAPRTTIVSIVCDKILHESARMTSCEIRHMLYDVLDIGK